MGERALRDAVIVGEHRLDFDGCDSLQAPETSCRSPAESLRYVGVARGQVSQAVLAVVSQ
jgi:hypothetical protein